MKNAYIYLLIGVVLIAGVFFLGRWSKRDGTGDALAGAIETSETATNRIPYLVEYLRSTERQNREAAKLAQELGDENTTAQNLAEGIGADNSTITGAGESIDAGLGTIAEGLEGIIQDLTEGEN